VYVAFVQAVGCVLALSVGIVAANNRGGTPLAFVEFLTVAAIASTLFAFFAVKINGAVIGVAANYTAAVLLPMFSLHALLDGWEDYTKEFTFRPGLGYLFLLFLFMALLAVADITTLSALRTGHAAATTGEKSDRPPANGPRNDQNN
jgi:hypothetical protein